MRGAVATCLAMIALCGCSDPPVPAEKLVEEPERYYGKKIQIRGKFRSGARCRIEGESTTYCKDCQFCRGPLVLDARIEGADDWPLILGGTWQFKDIRCVGPLNAIECWPIQPGKLYELTGFLERHKPLRFLVQDIKEIPPGRPRKDLGEPRRHRP